MNCSLRIPKSLAVIATSLVMASLAAACSADRIPTTMPNARAASYSSSPSTSTTFTLSSITPPIQCVDASGATTTVTGGTVTLIDNGKFTATFATSTTSGGVVTSSSVTEKGSFTQSGSTLVFKAPGAGAFNATLDAGTLTVADYPYCGATHTAIFTQL
jgi:hypothetical protein